MAVVVANGHFVDCGRPHGASTLAVTADRHFSEYTLTGAEHVGALIARAI